MPQLCGLRNFLLFVCNSSAMSGAPDYEQKELRSSKEHISAVLRMARAELLLLFFTQWMNYTPNTGKNTEGF